MSLLPQEQPRVVSERASVQDERSFPCRIVQRVLERQAAEVHLVPDGPLQRLGRVFSHKDNGDGAHLLSHIEIIA